MSDRPKARMGSGPFFSNGITDALQVQMQALLQEQAELLDEIQKMMAAWTKRRVEAVAANVRAFGAMGSCANPTAISAAYGEWLRDSMNRIFADMVDVREEALRLAERGRKSVAAVVVPQGAEASPTIPVTATGRIEIEQTKATPFSEADLLKAERKAAE